MKNNLGNPEPHKKQHEAAFCAKDVKYLTLDWNKRHDTAHNILLLLL